MDSEQLNKKTQEILTGKTEDKSENMINNPSLDGKMHSLKDIDVMKGNVTEKRETVNSKLSERGEALLGTMSVKELNENSVDEKAGRQIDKPLISPKTRRKILGADKSRGKSIKADVELRVIGKNVVKSGAFSQMALNMGESFMSLVDRWAGKSEQPSELEKTYYRKVGASDTLDFLYVDGKPLREFVRDRYGYEGEKGTKDEKAVLSAYVGMISARQNHPITLVRPTFEDGRAGVDIRDLKVNMNSLGKGLFSKANSNRRAIKGEDYRKYCETAYRSDMAALSAKAAREALGRDIRAMNRLRELKTMLKMAGKGTHRNYDNFVWSFNRYYDYLVQLTSEPENMDIDREVLRTLYHFNKLVRDNAADYLKGKNMKLRRHHAVKDIKDFLTGQSEGFKEASRKKTEDGKMSLADILDINENKAAMGEGEDEPDIRINKNEHQDELIIKTNEKDEPVNINIRVSEGEDVIVRDKQKEDDREAMNMTYKENILGNKISRKEFEEQGGIAKRRFVTVADAEKIVEKNYGFIAAKKVEGKEGIVELVPSLPEYTTAYGAEKSEKRIPLRKTLKTMLKTIVYILVDGKGQFRKNTEEYDGKSIAQCLDDFMQLQGDDPEELENAKQLLDDIIKPAMEKVLEKNYKAKSVKGYKQKARDDAAAVCRDYLEIVMGMRGIPFKEFTSVQTFDNFIKLNNKIKSLKASDVMKHKRFKNIKINGKNLTKEEVEAALKEFRKEAVVNMADFAQIRNMDIDSVEMPGFGSCNENTYFKSWIMGNLVDIKEPHQMIVHEYKDFVKNNPERALDIMVENLDNIIESGYNDEEAEKNKEIIRNLDKKRKSEPLDQADKEIIKKIYVNCSKYEWHKATNLGTHGNVLCTEETFAALPDQLQKAPITNNVMIGMYYSDKPAVIDDESKMLKHQSFSSFYAHDDSFAHCSEHSKLVKTKLKDLIYRMAGVI